MVEYKNLYLFFERSSTCKKNKNKKHHLVHLNRKHTDSCKGENIKKAKKIEKSSKKVLTISNVCGIISESSARRQVH